MNVIKNIVRRKELQKGWTVDYDGRIFQKSDKNSQSEQVGLTNYREMVYRIMNFMEVKIPELTYDEPNYNISSNTVASVYTTLFIKLSNAADDLLPKDSLREKDRSLFSMDFAYQKEIFLESAVQLYIYTQFFMPLLIYGYDKNVIYLNCRKIHDSETLYEIWNTGCDQSKYLTAEKIREALDMIRLGRHGNTITISNPHAMMMLIQRVYICCATLCIGANFTYSDFLATYLILTDEYDVDRVPNNVSDTDAARLLREINRPESEYLDLLKTDYARDCTEDLFYTYRAALKSDREEKKETPVSNAVELSGKEKSHYDIVYQILTNFNGFSEKNKERAVNIFLQALEACGVEDIVCCDLLRNKGE